MRLVALAFVATVGLVSGSIDWTFGDLRYSVANVTMRHWVLVPMVAPACAQGGESGGYPCHAASIAKVNTAVGSDQSGSIDAIIATGAFNLGAGNAILVAVRAGQPGGQSWPPTITDTAGDSFTLINTASNNPNSQVSCWLGKNTGSNVSNVVTASFAGTWYFAAIATVQYSGVDKVAPLDTSATGTSPGATSVTSGSFTTTKAKEVLVAAASPDASGGTFTAGSGYTVEVADSGTALAIEDRIVNSIQTGATASISYSASQPWGICVAALKAAGQ
jgi:hypothetical protein